MRSTLRTLVLAPVVLAAAALAANTAMASEVHVNVPFTFSVAGKICPAGAYRVDEDRAHGLVTLQSADSSRSFTWILRPGDPAPNDKHVALRFDQQGHGYALRSVQFRSLITSRLDKAGSHSEHKTVNAIEGQ